MALVAVSRNWVQVNQLEREAVYRFAHEQFPGLCLSRTCTAITRGGLQVSVKRFGRDAELDDEHKRLIREEWGQQFEPQLVWYLKTFGMAVVKPVPHPRLPGEMLPHLVPWNKYTLFFNESSVDQRRYYVAYNDAKYETLDETTQRQVGAPTVQEMLVSNDPSMRVQQNENNIGYPMWNGGKSHMIFVMHPPRTDGGLTSPVNAMRQEMLMMRRMLENEEYASYWAPRPLHATEVVRDFTSTGGGGGGNRDAMVTLGPGTFGPQDKQDEERLRRLRKNLEEHIDLQLATRAAREGRQLTIEEKQQFKQSLFEVGQAEKPTASDLNPAAMVSPSEHMLPLPVNQHLVGGPTPSSYSNLKDIMEILFPLAYATMNIPESIIKPGGSQVKGDPEMAKQEWDHFIKSQQEILGHMLEEIYSVCYNERGRSFINAFYRVWKEEAKALKRKSSSDLSTRDEPFQEAKQALQRAGRTELADLLRKQRQDTMKQVVTQNVRVTIAHDYTPSVSIELLMQARQLNVFDDDYLVQSVGRLLCVPTEKILNKQQREAQKNAQVEEQASTLDTQLKVKSKYGEKPGDSDVKGAFPSPAKKQKS